MGEEIKKEQNSQNIGKMFELGELYFLALMISLASLTYDGSGCRDLTVILLKVCMYTPGGRRIICLLPVQDAASLEYDVSL